VLQCVAMCISINVYNIHICIYISSRGFGERCLVSQLNKLHGSWYSTPMPIFCVICTIDSELKCILDLYHYEKLAGLILKTVMYRDRHPLVSSGLVRDSPNCKCVAVCCSMLQCFAVCCSVLQWTGSSQWTGSRLAELQVCFRSDDVTPLASDAAQCVAVLRMTFTLQHTATHCSTMQHTATHCNTLQHTEQCSASLGEREKTEFGTYAV